MPVEVGPILGLPDPPGIYMASTEAGSAVASASGGEFSTRTFAFEEERQQRAQETPVPSGDSPDLGRPRSGGDPDGSRSSGTGRMVRPEPVPEPVTLQERLAHLSAAGLDRGSGETRFQGTPPVYGSPRPSGPRSNASNSSSRAEDQAEIRRLHHIIYEL